MKKYLLLSLLCFLIFSCDSKPNFILGGGFDMAEEIEAGHSTEYIFYEEDPTQNSSAKSVAMRFKIGNEIVANSIHISGLRYGMAATGWVFCDPDDAAAEVPENVKVSSSAAPLVESVNVTLKPLCFYATEWFYNVEVPYTVCHLVQTVDLADYSLYQAETGNALPETPIDTQSFTKEIPGFEYHDHTEGVVELDGSAKVYIYYNRKEITVTINSEAGTFAGDATKTSQTITGRYGAPLTLPTLSKTDWHIKKIVNDGTGGSVAELPETFPLNDESYTVLWEIDSAGIKITVTFNPIDNSDISISKAESGVVTFTVSVPAGIAASTYKWLIDGAALSDGAGVSGSATNALSITKSAYNAGVYLLTALVTGSDGRLYSASGYLTVTKQR